MNRFDVSTLRDRPFFFPALVLLVGAALGPTEDDPIVLLSAAFVLSTLALAFSARVGSHLLLLAASGFMGTGLATLHSRVEVPPQTIGAGKIRLQGELEEVRAVEGGSAATVRIWRAGGRRAHFRARLFVEGRPAPRPGAHLLFRAALSPVSGARNPGEHDRAPRWEREGLLATASARADALVPLTRGAPAEAWMAAERAALARRVERLAPDAEAAALYLTLAAGLRASLGEPLEDAFSKSGLAHVLSVSGLHVAALALFALAALRRLVVRLPWRRLRRLDARRLAAPLSIPPLWGYVAFTGFQAPAVRSALMATLWLLGLLLVRRSDALNALSLAVLAVFAVDPAALADLSTQLSVLAVLGLLFVAPAVRAALPVPLPSPLTATRRGLFLQRAREAALQSAAASAAAMLATLPLIAQVFHRVGWVGVLSNAVCLPLNGAVSVAAAAGAAVHVALPALAAPALWLGAWLSWALVQAARLFAALPASAVDVPAPSPLAAALWWAGLFGVALLPGRWRLTGLALPAAAALTLLLPRAATPPLEVTFLAVGHGDAIFLSSQGEHALVDGGGAVKGGEVGKRVVASYLKQRQVESLALAALTHPHPDHANGLAEALRTVETRLLWLPEGSGQGPLVSAVVRAAAGADVQRVKAGDARALGGATLEVLGPPRDRLLLESENDRSLVLLVRHGAVTFLLTGDIEEAGEEALAPGPVTVVKAPHHGSETSSTPELVETTRPRFVVFCVGNNQRFNFPRASVVRRWEAVGARCYRTDRDGAITFHSDGKEVRVETFKPARAQARRLPHPASRR